MKSSKILLILASAALLASCGGGSTSSAAGTSSAGTSSAATTSEASKPADTSAQPPVASSEPEPEPSSEPAYSSAEAKVGKEVLLKSVQKSLSNDAIAINGTALANGRGHSVVGGSYDGSKETYYEGDIVLTAAYNLDAAVSGLKAKNPSDLKVALGLNGAHNLEVTMDGAPEPLLANTMELDEGAYFVDKVGYFNFSETFAALMAETTGYPYGAGKVHTPVAEIPESVFPLLNDEVIGQAVQGFEQILAYGDMLFPGHINYAVAGNKWKVELALDADSILNLVKTLAGDEAAAMYSKMIGLLDIDECALSINFTEDGLEALHLGIDADLDATYGEIYPTGMEIPAEIKNKEFMMDVFLSIDFEFSFGGKVTLPSDLDTYEEAVYSNPHGGQSQTPYREYMSAEQVLEFTSQFEDPEFTSLTVIDSATGSVNLTAKVGDRNWDGFMNDPTIHLSRESLDALMNAGVKYEFWIEKGDLYERLYQETDSAFVQYTSVFTYDTGFRYCTTCELYAESLATGEAQSQFVYVSWGFDGAEETSEVEPVDTSLAVNTLTLDDLKKLAASVEDPGYDKLDLFRPGEESLEHYMEVDADSPMWAYVQDFKFHLSLQNIEAMEAQLGTSDLLTAEFAMVEGAIVGTFTFEGYDSNGGFEGTSVIAYDPSTLYTLFEATQYDYKDDAYDYVDVMYMEWSFR